MQACADGSNALLCSTSNKAATVRSRQSGSDTDGTAPRKGLDGTSGDGPTALTPAAKSRRGGLRLADANPGQRDARLALLAVYACARDGGWARALAVVLSGAGDGEYIGDRAGPGGPEPPCRLTVRARRRRWGSGTGDPGEGREAGELAVGCRLNARVSPESWPTIQRLNP